MAETLDVAAAAGRILEARESVNALFDEVANLSADLGRQAEDTVIQRTKVKTERLAVLFRQSAGVFDYITETLELMLSTLKDREANGSSN